MSGTTRRKLSAIDDPLFPPSTPLQREPKVETKRTAALYVELPVEQWDALARAAFELRTHKRLIVASLIANPTTDGRALAAGGETSARVSVA